MERGWCRRFVCLGAVGAFTDQVDPVGLAAGLELPERDRADDVGAVRAGEHPDLGHRTLVRE